MCDQPSRSEYQKASAPSFVTYQLTGSPPDGGPISTKVLDESRAITCTAPLFASTDARYTLLEPRVNQVTNSLSDPALHTESRAEPKASWLGTGVTFTATLVFAATSMTWNDGTGTIE